ncbi:hypothetical protein H310_01981 [Aphanomyces invadans]|uniref:Fe2OG dioxygenase domain-containing protein n=1 Tax=Aphanomyces invadans TaxID=157072 RepID=A0A024UM13_9STRA|nr:hypothetical protein H310_01981 [Aphanomyces invadans]ETW07471.1 hypothetical protein H310_01981 [Aphanomyces invadans]|eukprot:XP_008863564.1 hypothetical protein H310_01981 [Aphanomyces invadans]
MPKAHKPANSPATSAAAGSAFTYHVEENPSVQYASSFLEPCIPVYARHPTLDLLYDGSIQRLRYFMTKSECHDAIAFATSIGFTHVFHSQTSEYAFRDNDRLLLRSPQLAAQLWERLHPFLPPSLEKAVGCNPAIKFYRYRTGQAFGCHVDESVVDELTSTESRYTLLVYLNDSADSGLVGGATRFYVSTSSSSRRPKKSKKREPATKESVLDVMPETGMVLMHGHGDHCLEHEGARVDRGEKYVLRTDVMFAL